MSNLLPKLRNGGEPGFTDLNQTTDSTLYEADQMNMTCPPDLIGGAFDQQFIHSLSLRDSEFHKDFDMSVTNAFVGQDPCSLADDERDHLLRKKRKEDAFKTALCESHRRTGMCSYGDECRFAHGVEQLRLPTQPRGRSHPKYKTVLCDKFSTTGYCKYGARCQFIHKLTNPVLLKQREAMLGNINEDEENTIPHLFGERSNATQKFRSYAPVPKHDLNQSMPMERPAGSDIQRAFARAVDSSSVTRFARSIENRQMGYGMMSFGKRF